jgi:DNA-binding IscR family transcriptional regulator
MTPAEKITLMDVIEALDGRDFFDNCYVTGERCNFDEPDKGLCILHNELREEKIRMEKFFSSKSIEALVNQLNSDQSIKI